MLRLKKTKAVTWLGNGFGSASAEWTLADPKYPGWKIFQLGSDWHAKHTDGAEIWGWSRAMLLEKLEKHLINAPQS